MDVHEREGGVGDIPQIFYHAVAAVTHTGDLEPRLDNVQQYTHMPG